MREDERRADAWQRFRDSEPYTLFLRRLGNRRGCWPLVVLFGRNYRAYIASFDRNASLVSDESSRWRTLL